MARTKRPWGVVAAPLVFFVGLGGWWGTQSLFGLKDQIHDVQHQLETTSEQVVVRLPKIPKLQTLYINGRGMGHIERIVVERAHPKSVDSVLILADVDRRFMRELERCAQIRLRIAGEDLEAFKSALRCTADTQSMVPFGHLAMTGSSIRVPIVVRSSDLPCGNGNDVFASACASSDLANNFNFDFDFDFDFDFSDLKLNLGELETELARMEVELAKIQSEKIKVDVNVRQDIERARDQLRAAVRSTVRTGNR